MFTEENPKKKLEPYSHPHEKVTEILDNAVKKYNDCTELYWQFLKKSNTMPGKNITATIRLPKEVYLLPGECCVPALL